jgi:hypothetical protein
MLGDFVVHGAVTRKERDAQVERGQRMMGSVSQSSTASSHSGDAERAKATSLGTVDGSTRLQCSGECSQKKE